MRILVNEKLYMSWQCAFEVQSQLYCGVHKKKCDQQVKRLDPPHLLHSCETTSGVLYPNLGCPAQEGHEAIRVGPEDSHKNDQRIEHLFYEEKLRAGFVQPEKRSGET